MDERSEIALVIADLGSGGAQRVLLRAAEGLAARGRRVCVVTLSDPSADFFSLPSGVRRFSVGGIGQSANPLAGMFRNLGRVVRLRRALRACNAGTALSFVTQTNVLLLIAGIGLGMRLVVSERNDPARQTLSPVWRLLRGALYRFADVVTANSEGAVESLGRLVRGIRPVLLPNPPPPLHPPVDAGRPPKTLLNVGRLHPQKGQDTLIDAFALLAPAHPELQLVIAGTGDSRASLEALAEAHGVRSRVTFAGAVADIDALYRNAGVFVLPSRHEGTPNALIEAMGHGLPCVASDASPGIRAALSDGIEGLLVPPEDPKALAVALDRLLGSAELRVRLGSGAHARATVRNDPLARWEAILDAGGAI
jgi:GalNAc-alpha-(1->4)-GalNAc-alpha-(1->3)-diNAcBac-PP-undecaprenol alpha-1,4-N-acetyl-D-galactosaminyltransferase